MSTYVPVQFEDGVTPLNAETFNHLEDRVELLDAVKVPDPAAQDDKWLRAEGGAMVWQALAAADIPDISATYQARSERGAVSGYATLDATGKVPAAQLPAAGGAGAKQFPIDFRNPNVGVAPGATYPLVLAVTGWEEWAWGFSATAAGYVYGVFRLPETVAAGNATLRFELSSAAAGNVVTNVWLKGIADGESLNISTWDWGPWTVTTTLVARARKVLTSIAVAIGAGQHLQAGDLCVVVFGRDGAAAGDTNAGVMELLYGALVLD